MVSAVWVNRSISRSRNWWTLRSLVSRMTSAALADRLQQVALDRDALDHAVAGHGMAAPGAFVAPHQHLVGGLEKKDLDPGTGGPELGHRRAELLELAATASDDQGHPVRLRPGAETRSATLEIMAVGMLSITNQPRSSKLAAACERPAPDRPVMIRNSATLSIVAAGRAGEAHTGSFSARRNKRRGMLAASAYSWARSRNPGGGAGSSMRVMCRPAATMALT